MSLDVEAAIRSLEAMREKQEQRRDSDSKLDNLSPLAKENKAEKEEGVEKSEPATNTRLRSWKTMPAKVMERKIPKKSSSDEATENGYVPDLESTDDLLRRTFPSAEVAKEKLEKEKDGSPLPPLDRTSKTEDIPGDVVDDGAGGDTLEKLKEFGASTR